MTCFSKLCQAQAILTTSAKARDCAQYILDSAEKESAEYTVNSAESSKSRGRYSCPFYFLNVSYKMQVANSPEFQIPLVAID